MGLPVFPKHYLHEGAPKYFSYPEESSPTGTFAGRKKVAGWECN